MATQEPDSNGDSSTANIITYHCPCTQLSLATIIPLESLPKRQLDAAIIATTDDFASPTNPSLHMQALVPETEATVLKLDDGFEKRYEVRCTRCGLAAGYHLDQSHFSPTQSGSGPRTDLLYVFPGSLVTTEETGE